ncbi:MAG: gliding motility-associated C-terminal domain-containing protein [Bacteroidota bacterium]
MWNRIILILFVTVVTVTIASAQAVTTIAGAAGITGATGGPGNNARFNSPHGVATDRSGNIYIADRLNHCIRKINSAGIVTTIAGTGLIGGTDGPDSVATFYEPWAVACDSAGNLYVADTRNYKIRKINTAGIVSTIAGQGTFGTTNGPAALAKFGFPTGICVTPDGSVIYVADHNTHVIRKIYNGNVTNLSGVTYIAGSADGGAGTATFNHPNGIELDNSGNIIVADEWSNMIRLVSSTGFVTTMAGNGTTGSTDGQPASAMFNSPFDVAVDNIGNIYVADGYNSTIRKMEFGSWIVSTYAGVAVATGSANGLGAAARFNEPSGIACQQGSNTLYVGDDTNELVRKITAVSALQISLSTTAVSNTVCFGDSIPVTSSLSGFSGYTYYDNGNVIGSAVTASVNLPPLSSGNHTITCTSTDNAGLTVLSNSLTITVKAPYIPIISPATPQFCNGDSTQISAGTATSYLWNQGSTAQSIYILTAGPFTVTATATDGCKGSTTVTATVSIGPPAVISPSSGSAICPGDSVLLSASTGNTYLWSDGSTTQNIYASQITPYSVTVSDATGCSNISSLYNINFFAGSIATISPAGPIVLIQGDSITLSSGNAATYSWSTSATTQNITVVNNGNYTVSITTADGCSSVSTPVQVNIITLQQMISATGALSFCEGNSVTLQSIFSQGNQWYFNGAILPGENTQELAATDSGYYQVAVNQNGNWIYSDSVLVAVLTTPQMADVTDTTVCEGEKLLLVASTEPFVTIKWYDVDTGGVVLGMGSAYQTAALIQPITYYIEVTGQNGCVTERSPLFIMTNPSPVADFTYAITGQTGSFTVTLNNTTILADYYNWTLHDTSYQVSQQVSPAFTVTHPGEYEVWLVADNASGCRDSVYRNIYIGASDDWFIPNTFTPNNDGKNDLFRVRGKGIVTKEMKIYDQWGSLLYLADSNGSWDGTVNGETVQNGTYMYHIVISKNDQDEVVTGAITVIK